MKYLHQATPCYNQVSHTAPISYWVGHWLYILYHAYPAKYTHPYKKYTHNLTLKLQYPIISPSHPYHVPHFTGYSGYGLIISYPNCIDRMVKTKSNHYYGFSQVFQLTHSQIYPSTEVLSITVIHQLYGVFHSHGGTPKWKVYKGKPC